MYPSAAPKVLSTLPINLDSDIVLRKVRGNRIIICFIDCISIHASDMLGARANRIYTAAFVALSGGYVLVDAACDPPPSFLFFVPFPEQSLPSRFDMELRVIIA